MDKNKLDKHILQQEKVLVEFDIVSSTTLEEFMDTYKQIAETSDDISQLKKVSSLLNKKDNVKIHILLPNSNCRRRKSNFR